MLLVITECECTYGAVATWFSGTLQKEYEVAEGPHRKKRLVTKTWQLRGPFEIIETVRHPVGALVRCLFNGWNELGKPISLTVGFTIPRECTHWGTLGLDHAMLTEDAELKRMTWDEQLAAPGAARASEDEFFAPIERMFLLSYWMELSERSMYRLPGLHDDRIKWELERDGLAVQYGRDAITDPYEYSRRRLGNRVEKLEAEPLPWADLLAADTAAPSSRANIIAQLMDGITVAPIMN